MKLRRQADLGGLNTFGVPAMAGALYEIESEEDLLELPPLDPDTDLALGGGSNILFAGNVPGALYLNRIRGLELIDTGPDHVLVEAGAGENWHQLVMAAVRHRWHGLENLALIPGLAGAAPIQNIGAYGVELASVLDSVTAWDWQNGRWVALTAAQCELGYRDSIFKSVQPDRYMITSIRLRLQRQFRPQLDYAGLRQALGSPDPGRATAAAVCAAVIALRQRKLPDPSRQGNAGSFFKNPVLPADVVERLRAIVPHVPCWPADGGAKISAAWLIEHCGLKGLSHGGAAVSLQHALVLVNQSGQATGTDILALAREVQRRVADHFGISLDPEPRIYPATADATAASLAGAPGPADDQANFRTR